jgi:hypothetical protein
MLPVSTRSDNQIVVEGERSMPRPSANHVFGAVGALLDMKQGKNTRDEASLLYVCAEFGISTREDAVRGQNLISSWLSEAAINTLLGP